MLINSWLIVGKLCKSSRQSRWCPEDDPSSHSFHPAQESLRRLRADRYSQVLLVYVGQVWELWYCHQRMTHSMFGWPPRLVFLLQHATHDMCGWPPRLVFLLQHAGPSPWSSSSLSSSSSVSSHPLSSRASWMSTVVLSSDVLTFFSFIAFSCQPPVYVQLQFCLCNPIINKCDN